MLHAVDLHTHIIPIDFIETALKNPNKFTVKINAEKKEEGCFVLHHDQGYVYEVTPPFYNLQARLLEMERRNLTHEVLSVSPTLFYYWSDLGTAREVARLCNDALEKWVQARPGQFKVFGTVPMQDCKSAVSELEYLMSRPGFVGVEIGGVIEGTPIADPSYLPFFEAAEALGAVIFIHPYFVGPRPGLERHYLTNLIGNPLESSIAIGLLILEGVFQKYPKLKVLAAHGGGYLPYGIGRIDHGYRVRKETGPDLEACPSIFLGTNVYCDCITHDPKALVYLKNKLGVGKVLLGSDYPFDMGLDDPVGFVKENPELTEQEKEAILFRNSERLGLV